MIPFMNRRGFVKCGAGASATLGASLAGAADDGTMTVAVIGHTGRGNYGHGLDTVWRSVPSATLVAVADPDAAGLAEAGERLGLGKEALHPDYRAMLQEVRPDLVAVCPRHVDQHRDMALAAIEAGVRGIYIEKPFLRSPAECDEVLTAARDANTKIAVAHRNRYHPVLQAIDRLVEDGKIGTLLEIRGRGKGDRRGGVEDLWVLGTHVLNLMSYFGGTPLTCSATLYAGRKRVEPGDVFEGGEGLGPMAGDELHARYRFSRGVTGTFDSIANDGTRGAGFGLQLVGSEGLISLRCDRDPLAHFVPGSPFAEGEPRPWVPVSTAGIGEPEPREDLPRRVMNHVAAVENLIASVKEDREPTCGAGEGAATVEMVCAVLASHVAGGAELTIPLVERENALAAWNG